jgi:sensor histidine kinase YesM
LQQLHRNREKKKTLPGEAEGGSEGNSAGTDWRMLSSFSFQSLLPLFLVFVLFSLVMASSWGFFVFVSLYGFLLSSLLLSFASLMSVFIVSASLRV